DGAGIYITFCKGIVVRGNYIHDILDTGGYGASAYYLDEQAENCTVEDNLSVRVNRPSHNHMAKNNTIRRNVFVVEGDAQLTFPRSTEFTLEKNVIYATGKVVLSNPAAVKTWTNNMVYSGKGQVEGVPAEVARDDPLFVNPTQGDYRFKPESSALALGLQPVDVSGAGRTGH
ncbi:MAG: right-handed parallel beta-helix repeat-containing protein, partial [Armatimonadetes bacterium]|nr:right-handed parallel beta-helix repeat-containing protein [Armatimonadota bacterium]